MHDEASPRLWLHWLFPLSGFGQLTLKHLKLQTIWQQLSGNGPVSPEENRPVGHSLSVRITPSPETGVEE